MNYLNQLISLLFTPIGFIGVAIALVFITILYKEQYRPLHWFLVSATAFAASLKGGQEFPPLTFPLEQIRAQGRPITIILLGLLLVIIFLSKRSRGQTLIPSPLPYLIFIQLLGFLYTIYGGGNQAFAILALLTFGSMIAMMLYGPSRWLETEADFKWGVLVIAMVGMIFTVVNLYQGFINLYPITFTHGRFLGTTGNPQHAATLLATTLPAFLYLAEEETRRPWLKGIWLIFLGIIALGLVMTGSRTGVGMAVIGVMLFYGFSTKIITRIGLAIFSLFLISLVFEPAQQWFLEIAGSNLERFSDIGIKIGQNEVDFGSREGVWKYQWRQFTSNPLFGKEINNRIHIGENSWLGIAAQFGLVGLTPLLLFAWEGLKMIWQLYQYGKRNPNRQKQCNLVIAGLLALFAGAWFEGYLVGIITFSVMALLQYLILGQFLLQRQRQEKLEQQAMLGATS